MDKSLSIGGVCALVGFALAVLVKDVSVGPTAVVIFGFALMAWPLISERLSKLTFGKEGLSLELRERLAAVEQTAAGAAASVGGLTAMTGLPARKESLSGATGDTQKGLWGGRSAGSGRRMSAQVTRVGSTDLAKVAVVVSPELGAPPLSGQVAFHLHETFKPFDIQRVSPAANGSASLELVSYGAFTVGVEADGGATKLELDLAQADGAFEPWKLR